MNVTFSENSWNPSDFIRVYSLRTPDPSYPVFMQERDCIVNDDRHLEKGTMAYHYISLVTAKTCTSPVTLETVCDFEEFGAPLLVLSDDLVHNEDGRPAYGHHFEIVAYEKGFNIWELNGKEKPLRVACETFEVPAKTRLDLRAAVDAEKNEITVSLYGKTFTEYVERLPRTFHAGITACEGVNRFYSFSAE